MHMSPTIIALCDQQCLWFMKRPTNYMVVHSKKLMKWILKGLKMLCLYILLNIGYILHFNHTLAVNRTPVKMTNCQIWSCKHVKILQKKRFVGKMDPANSTLFIYVSNHYEEWSRITWTFHIKAIISKVAL